MAWSTPLTAVSNATFTAAQYNASDRDNMLLTPAALATAAGQMWVSTGVNAGAVRTPSGAVVNTSQTSSSTSYADLATVGPQVSVTTGTQAVVLFASEGTNNTNSHHASTAVDISGATTRAANDVDATRFTDGTTASVPDRRAGFIWATGLTAGTNTFTLKYRVQVGTDTGTFSNRSILVIPF